MMNKSTLIFKHFQKSDKLTVKNHEYQQTITSLFRWLIQNDNIENDKTTKYFPDADARAIIIAKQTGVIAGLEEVGYLLEKYTKLVSIPKTKDGSVINSKETIAEITGKSHDILGYERTILNIFQRMSGIATETNRLVKSINRQRTTDNKKPYIAATRKTPWMAMDKKAVSVGGGLTHRLNLSDGILVKDNHIAMIIKAFHFKTDEEAIEKAMKSIIGMVNAEAVKTPQGWPTYKDSPGVEELEKQLIEIEVKSEKEAYCAINTYHKLISHNNLAIMFDNFTPKLAKQTLIKLRKEFDLSSIIFEASGGIDEKNILEWAKTGVDILSLGSLTHSTPAANLSLELVTK